MTILFYFLAFVCVVILIIIWAFAFDRNGFKKVVEEQGFEVAKANLTFLMAAFTLFAGIAAIIKFYFKIGWIGY